MIPDYSGLDPEAKRPVDIGPHTFVMEYKIGGEWLRYADVDRLKMQRVYASMSPEMYDRYASRVHGIHARLYKLKGV